MSSRTVASVATVEGIGLHSGRPARLRLLPASGGIRFRRVDLAGSPDVPATLEAVRETARGLTLGDPPVRTVEHLLSAAAGLGITSLLVEVEGEELPAGDGSALPFVEAIVAAGLAGVGESPAALAVREPVVVSRGEALVAALPAERFSVTYAVTSPRGSVPGQVATYAGEGYEETVAPARTWGSVEEAEALRARGLALGASLDNTLVLGPEGFLNPPRFPDELARHKILDLLGDLSLLGAPLRAAIVAVGAGHALHVALAWALKDRAVRIGEWQGRSQNP